jgi:hypothetical protein
MIFFIWLLQLGWDVQNKTWLNNGKTYPPDELAGSGDPGWSRNQARKCAADMLSLFPVPGPPDRST